MRRLILMCALMLMSQMSARAQAPDTTWQGEMAKLKPMVGEWRGEGWIQRGPEGRSVYLIHERVEEKTGGRILLIQGLGREKAEDGSEGRVIHDALAVVSWDAGSGSYRFDAHTAQAGHVETSLTIGDDGTMRWGLTTPGGEVRYTITLDEKTWHEVGEFQPKGREESSQFMEMKLERVR